MVFFPYGKNCDAYHHPKYYICIAYIIPAALFFFLIERLWKIVFHLLVPQIYAPANPGVLSETNSVIYHQRQTYRSFAFACSEFIQCPSSLDSTRLIWVTTTAAQPATRSNLGDIGSTRDQIRHQRPGESAQVCVSG